MIQENNPRNPGAPAPGAPVALDLWRDGGGFGSNPRVEFARALAFLKRSALRIALTAVGVAALLVLLSFLVFNRYVASALVLVDPRDSKISATPDVIPNIGPDSIAIESLVQVAKSDGFLGALVDQLHLADDPEIGASGGSPADQRAEAIEKLRDRLAVTRRGATYAIDMIATTRDPQRSARIANGAAQMFVDDQAKLRTGSDEKAAAYIESKLAGMRARIQQDDDAVASLKTALNITDAGQGEVVQERNVTELSQQLVLAEAHVADAKAHVDQLRAMRITNGASLPAELQSTVLASLLQDRARLTRQAAEQEAVLGARHPDIVKMRAQIEDNSKAIVGEQRRITASASQDYDEALRRESALAEAMRKAQAASGATDQSEVKLRALESNAKADHAVFDELLSRQRQLTEIMGFKPSDVRVVSPAMPPLRTNAPKTSILLAACGILGLIAGLGFALISEDSVRTPATRGQIRRAFRRDALAFVPMLAEARAATRESSRIFARIAKAMPEGAKGFGAVVLVTSTEAGEGKSTIARELAGAFAQGSAETLLVICGAAPQIGARRRADLIDVLEGGAPLERALSWRSPGQPALLTFGAGSTRDLAGLVESLPFRQIMRRCQRSFDAIVIDGPSAGRAATAHAAMSDQALVVVQWNATDPRHVERMIEGLGAGRTEIIMNKVDMTRLEEAPPGPADSLAA
jgi:succinoglycan biosynthesis transport protein ExoP